MNKKFPNTEEVILDKSIVLLKKEGLNFSVDSLVSSLHISKKTVYRYYHSKEDLALALFKRAYQQFEDEITKKDPSLHSLLVTYLKSLQFSRGDLFNRYSLNDQTKAYSDKLQDQLYISLCQVLVACDYAKPVSIKGFRLVLEGSLLEISKSQDIDQGIDSLIALVF
jgi:AcrR family transcriptional regulator